MKKKTNPPVSKTTWSTPYMEDSWVDATAFGDTTKTYLYKGNATTSSTPVHAFKPSTSTVTGTFGSSSFWNTIDTGKEERKAVWSRLTAIKTGHGNLGLDQIVKLVELQSIHGDDMGLVRFVLDERDDS